MPDKTKEREAAPHTRPSTTTHPLERAMLLTAQRPARCACGLLGRRGRGSASQANVRAASASAAEASPLDALAKAAPSWPALAAQHVTLTATSVGKPGNEEKAARALAVSRLNAESAFSVMDDQCVIGIYSDAFDGALENCGGLVDAHIRLVADALLTGTAAATSRGYAALRVHTEGSVAVGAAALLRMREEAEMEASLLGLAEEGERTADARLELGACTALCAAIDMVLAAMPTPQE